MPHLIDMTDHAELERLAVRELRIIGLRARTSWIRNESPVGEVIVDIPSSVAYIISEAFDGHIQRRFELENHQPFKAKNGEDPTAGIQTAYAKACLALDVAKVA